MTNLEKHREEFEYHLTAMMTTECENLIKTAGMHCSCECKACAEKFVDWLIDEATVDWSQVKPGTECWVKDKDDKAWFVRDFATFAFGKPWFLGVGMSVDNIKTPITLFNYDCSKLKEDEE